MTTKEYPKDKYGYEIPRCHHVNPITGEDCPDAPMTGEHFCPAHNPRITAHPTDPKRRCHYIHPVTAAGCGAAPLIGGNFCFSHDPDKAEERRDAQSRGGRNRRQPEPPPLLPPNLPRISVQTRGDILTIYEATINFVLHGQMDLRVANNIGYLAMGALMTIDSEERSQRLAMLDEQRAAQRAEDKAEKKAEKKAEREAQAAARAQKEADRAARAAGWPVPPNISLVPNKYGRHELFRGKVDYVTRDGHTETYQASGKGLEFISSTTNRPPTLAPDGSLNSETQAATTTAQAPKTTAQPIATTAPTSTATQTHTLPQPTTPPAQPEKPKRDRYTATETEWPEVPTY